MALSKSLKRKVDSENRAYKEEWKDNYAFILLSFVNAKLMCLIYNKVVAVFKEYDTVSTPDASGTMQRLKCV